MLMKAELNCFLTMLMRLALMAERHNSHWEQERALSLREAVTAARLAQEPL